jgi:hypothetical protein
MDDECYSSRKEKIIPSERIGELRAALAQSSSLQSSEPPINSPRCLRQNLHQVHQQGLKDCCMAQLW